jgi:TIR domain
VSHATEDDDRFARQFAERLRENGCRVWFDEWELLPGDSLVDKVFEEGLKDADAMVVVLSANSVDKRWVREELNAGFIKRVEGKCKLIPVVIDDVAVPEALKSTVWQKIDDLDNYDEELDRILRAIHDDRNRAEPGVRPRYAETRALPGLYSTDTLMLRTAGEMSVESDSTLVNSREILTRLAGERLAEQAYLDSLDVLEEHWYIRVHRTLGAGLDGASAFSLTTLGFDEYARNFIDGYDAMQTTVVAELVNTDRRADRQIAAETGIPRVLVEHILDVLESRGLVKVSKTTGPNSHVHHVSPQLGRMLAET